MDANHIAEFNVTVHLVYDFRRHSRLQLFGIFVDGVLTLVCTTYPSWLSKRAA